MELKKQSDSFYLFRLAFRSAKFSGKRIFITLSLLFLFVSGSLYTTNRLYKQKLASTAKTELISSPNNVSKSAATDTESKPKVKPIPLSAEYWQKRKQKGINQLNSQLHLYGSRERRKLRRGYIQREWKNEQAEKRIARHKSILAQPDEVAALQQDQLVFSERSPADDIPPLPKPKPKNSFWNGLRKDFLDAMKDILKTFL